MQASLEAFYIRTANNRLDGRRLGADCSGPQCVYLRRRRLADYLDVLLHILAWPAKSGTCSNAQAEEDQATCLMCSSQRDWHQIYQRRYTQRNLQNSHMHCAFDGPQSIRWYVHSNARSPHVKEEGEDGSERRGC